MQLSPDLLRPFTVFDVVDPDELGDDSRVSQRFPGYNNYNTFRLRDRRAAGARSTGLLSRLAVRRRGELTVSYVGSRYGTEVGIIGDGVPRLFLTFPLRGAITLQPGHTEAATAAGSTGLVYRGKAGTELVTSDNVERMSVMIDETRLQRTLESILGESCPDCPVFRPGVDWADPALAPVARLARHLFEEAGDPSGLFCVQPALETITDTLTLLVLKRLPHNYAERLDKPQSPAVPWQLRRAEAFMVAHAAEPISIADIAAAAGCGARALQLAFKRYRETTPLAALRDVRLQAVRAALATSDLPASLIARDYGFSNPTRFQSLYRRKFGETPRKVR